MSIGIGVVRFLLRVRLVQFGSSYNISSIEGCFEWIYMQKVEKIRYGKFLKNLSKIWRKYLIKREEWGN